MASFYVDTAADAGGNGTTSALTGANCAWDTIADVNAASFSGDDLILFKRGCTWTATLIPPSSGTSGHQITFGAYGEGADPIIDGEDTRDYCIEGRKNYLTITDLRFTGPVVHAIAHTQWSGPPWVEVATPGWIVENCYFDGCGVELFGPTSIVQDNTLVGPGPDALASAITFRGLQASNCQALRNNISGFQARGVWFQNAASSPICNDNIIDDIDFSDGVSGEGFGIDFDGYGALITGTITATGNTISNCAGVGIEIENCSDGSLINGNLIHDCPFGIEVINYAALYDYPEQRGNNIGAVYAYNIIYRARYGIKINEVGGIDIWNNVIYEGIGSYPKGLTISDAGTPPTYFATDIDFRNNIIGSGMTNSITTKYAWENHFVALDYNCFDDPVMEELSPSDELSLAELQAGDDCMNCFLTDPAFVSAEGHNFHLTVDSPCVDEGANLGLTSDFDGASVPFGGTPDIGAYEYTETGYECIKRWNGTAWVRAKVSNRTGGAAWENRPIKRWTGAAWSDVDGIGG